MKNLSFTSFTTFSKNYYYKFFFIISSFMFFILFNCASNVFNISPHDTNRSIAIVYIEVFEKQAEVQKTGNLGNKSTLILHLGGKIAKTELEKRIVRKLEVPFIGIEYTHALAQDPISDKKSYSKLRYGQGNIIYMINIPPGKFDLNKVKLPTKEIGSKLYKRWIHSKNFTTNILPSNVSFLGSYRVILNTDIEERYDPNGNLEIFFHSNLSGSDSYDGKDFDYEILIQPSEQEIIEKLLVEAKGSEWNKLLQNRLDEIKKYNKSGISNIDPENHIDHDSIIKQVIETLGGGNNIETNEIQSAMDVLDWYGPLSMNHLLNVFENKEKGDVNNLARRLNTITVLGKIGNKRAVEPLNKIIESEALNDQEREGAEKALKKIEEQRILYNRIESIHFNGRIEIVIYAFSSRLADYENRSIDFLIKSLDSYNPEVRMDALAVLMKNKYRVDTDKIVKFLKDDHEDVRLNASALLSLQKDKNSMTALIDALNDSSSAVKMNSIKGLLTIGNPGMLEHLEKLKNDPDELVRKDANTAISILKLLQKIK